MNFTWLFLVLLRLVIAILENTAIKISLNKGFAFSCQEKDTVHCNIYNEIDLSNELWFRGHLQPNLLTRSLQFP